MPEAPPVHRHLLSPSRAGPNSPAPSPTATSPRSDRRVDRSAPSRPTRNQSGKWAVAPIPKLSNVEGAANASNWAVRAGTSSRRRRREKAAAIDFLETIWGRDVDFYQKILVDQGAVGTLARRPRRRGLQVERRVLRRPARLAELLRPGSLPGSGRRTTASSPPRSTPRSRAQLPTIAQGGDRRRGDRGDRRAGEAGRSSE